MCAFYILISVDVFGNKQTMQQITGPCTNYIYTFVKIVKNVFKISSIINTC